MLADYVQHQPRIHNWEWHMSMTVIDMQVTARNGQRIVPGFGVKVDPNHSDAARPR